MNKYRILLLFIVAVLYVNKGISQEAAIIDSLQIAYQNASTVSEKVNRLSELTKVMASINPEKAKEYGEQLIAIAEKSRDRELMFKAYLSNGTRCAKLARKKSYIQKAIKFYKKALKIAQDNEMERQVALAQMCLSYIYLLIPDKEKALSSVTSAFSIASTLSIDSLLIKAHIYYGTVYTAKNDYIQALRNYLSALRIAKKTNNKPYIMSCYEHLSSIYSSIDDYDKAIDYMTKALNIVNEGKIQYAPYQKASILNKIGKLFSNKENHDIAISYFEKVIRMADTLNFPTMKVSGYIGLLNQYLKMDDPQRTLSYFNSPAGNAIKNYFKKIGFTGVIYKAYGLIYTQVEMYDSAGIYLQKALPIFESKANDGTKISFYNAMGNYYKKVGNEKKAIEYFIKVKDISQKNGYLEFISSSSKKLDGLYTEIGNLQEAVQYKVTYYEIQDSIETLEKKNKLAQIEAHAEQMRQERLQKIAKAEKRRKHNIQYLAIVIGILSLFVVLVMLGMFNVSERMIKAIGFFVFIMLFEFIFLVFKKSIHDYTHGVPWKDLAFMMALAAILIPLHHWVEHKVQDYLTSQNQLTSAGDKIRSRFFNRK